MKTPVTPEPLEPSKDHSVWVKKYIKCGVTQCGDCHEKASFNDTCLQFNKPLKRSRGGRVLRCRACLDADVKGGRR